jgi:arylsulfatase A-like enzyme
MSMAFLDRRHVALGAVVIVVAALAVYWSRSRSESGEPATIRLVDTFKADMVSGGAKEARQLPRTEFKADQWQAGPGIAGLTVREGRLVGQTTSDFPVLHLTRTSGFDSADLVHAIEVRMKVSAGSKVAAQTARAEKLDIGGQVAMARGLGGDFLSSAALTPGDDMQTYELRPLLHVAGTTTQHVLLRPTDVPGATFEIEAVRLVFRKEHLAGIASGVAWQGLKEIYRESLAARAPERIDVPVTLPSQPWLDLAIGTLEDVPATFKVAVREGTGDAETVLEHTLTTPHRWEPRSIDLRQWAGRHVTLSLQLGATEPGTLGFWGAPVVRSRVDRRAVVGNARRPGGVILIQADTLRRDHLEAYGYSRQTAPVVTRLAKEGALFRNYTVQATWTKVSTPSLMTSLYPTSHGVANFSDHLPAAANTLAESYRAAGYATVSLASVIFTGQFTNLHQGFEELHEDGSFSQQGSSKTAREYVDRLAEWLGRHRDTPFFAFLHVFDPHDPFEPRRPYDALWADPSKKEEHQKQLENVRKVIKEPLLRLFGMPSREELVTAGIDAEAFVHHDRDWYDGSIRGMDVEIGRLMQTLHRLGIADDTLVVFLSDHGEEFLEHDRMFHGQTVYGELTQVPLIMRWPAGLSSARVVDDIVQSIDVMPTLLELSGITAPDGLQGQSLAPLLKETTGGVQAAAWQRRPAITQKPLTDPKKGAAPPPHDTESIAINDGQWKLIRNTVRPHGGPEFELYDYGKDPLNRTDISAQHPEIVARLSKALDGWKQMAERAKLKPDTETTKNLSPEQLQRLRSLGYVR